MTTDGELISISRDQLRAIVREAVQETLTGLGIDHENPVEMQRDFTYLRDWRVAVEGAKNKTFFAIIGILVTGALGLLWIGFRDVLMGSSP